MVINMKNNIYRIPEESLHKKRYGKHTMTDIILSRHHGATSYASVFYHYTSPEGLKGILKNRVIFFTDCQFLNDYDERLQINDELELFWKENKRNYDTSFVSLLKNIKISNYEDNEFSYISRNKDYDTEEITSRYFVFSTSFNPDSLSLWKYYSKNNRYDGYCIGFATYALSDEWIDMDTGVAIEDGTVIYSSAEKQDMIFKVVEKLYDEWCIYKVSDDFNKRIVREFKSWVSITSLFFKNECFEDEKEYRFVAIAPSKKLKALSFDYNGYKEKMYDFRIVDGTLIPYIKIPFNFWNSENCWPISSIGISPSINYEQKKLGVEHFIKSFDYSFPNLQIYHSKVPLRY